MNTDKKTKVFLIFTFFLVGLVFTHNFNRYYVTKDYELTGYTSCDTSLYNCFLSDENQGDFSFYTKPYAKVSINAKYAPSCLSEHSCENFSCDSIQTCTLTYCDPESADPGEHCTDINK